MAASMLIETGSGTYTGRIRHPHNGYDAGNFSQTPRSGNEVHLPYPGRLDAPRAWQWWRTDDANPSVDQPAAYPATSLLTPMPTT